VLNDAGYKYDVVDAVLAAQSNNPAGCARAVKQLEQWVKRSDWTQVLDGYARCKRILLSQMEKARTSKDPNLVTEITETFAYSNEPIITLFADIAENELFEAVKKANPESVAINSVDDFFNAFVPMIPAISKFFEKVMVLTEDKSTRVNRLALLEKIARMPNGIVDLSKLEGF